jgi:hypothetical protein
MITLLELVQKQAADPRLWLTPVTDNNEAAVLQKALRELHEAVGMEWKAGGMSAAAHRNLARYHLQAAKFAETSVLLKK